MVTAFISASWDLTKKFYDDFIKNLDVSLIKSTNKNESIIFKNKSIIYFYSAGSSVLPVGLTVDYLFCDEFALYKKEVWDYLKPLVVAKQNAKVIIASTPRGKNAFYELCQLGIERKLRHKEYRMHYTDNPLVDMQQIYEDKQTMPTQLFNQEYECEFTDALSGVFGDFKAVLTITKWEESALINKKYFGGLDIAGAGGDKTVLTIIDNFGHTSFIYECENNDLVKQADELEPIIKKYNTFVLGEKTGIGQGLIDILRSRGCNVAYYNTSNESKQKLVTNLIININKKEIALPTVQLCPKLENELSCYGGKRTSTGLIKYEGEDGVHDDYVMSLMFAIEAKRRNYDHTFIYNNDEDIYQLERSKEIDFANTPMYMLQKRNTSWADNLKYD
jgi:hypothetical protein